MAREAQYPVALLRSPTDEDQIRAKVVVPGGSEGALKFTNALLQQQCHPWLCAVPIAREALGDS